VRLLPGSVDGRCSICAKRYTEAPTTLLEVVWGWEHVPVPDSDLDELPGYITVWTKNNPYMLAGQAISEIYGKTPREKIAAKKASWPSWGMGIGKPLWQKGDPIEGGVKLVCRRCRGSGAIEVAWIINNATAARRHQANAILLPLRRRR
jgi:hypothetical protein